MNLEQAEIFVGKTNWARWIGWTIELFRPDYKAMWSRNGVFRYGRWGFAKLVEPDVKGLYNV